jgi:hypothetical protein
VPINDSTGKTQGFFTAHYFLSEISLFLNQLQFSPTGHVFIMERSGNLVATSVKVEASATQQVDGKPDRLSTLHSQDNQTREVAQRLLQEFGSFDHLKQTQQLTLTTRGKHQFVQVTPYQAKYGLDCPSHRRSAASTQSIRP